jgi:hypothetical protein
MPHFELVDDEGLRAHFDKTEPQLLRELLAEMKLLLEADIPRADPVIARLFPDASDDPEEAETYRDLVGEELKANKVEALRVVTARLGKRGPLRTSIPENEWDAWLALLTDMRLAIGTRLQITEEKMEQELDPDDPDAPAMSVLHWLGWVQGSMLATIQQEDEDDYFERG